MPHTEPEAGKYQHWSHGGPVIKNGHYLLSTFGRYAISFLLGGLSAAFIVGGKTRDLSELLTWRGEVKATLERMDKDGTYSSQRTLKQQGDQIVANRAAIVELQQKTEPIGTMQYKLERLLGEAPTKK